MRASRKSLQQLLTSLNPYDHIIGSQVVKVLELVGLELEVLSDNWTGDYATDVHVLSHFSDWPFRILLNSHPDKFLGSGDVESFGAVGTRPVRSRANLLESFDVAWDHLSWRFEQPSDCWIAVFLLVKLDDCRTLCTRGCHLEKKTT